MHVQALLAIALWIWDSTIAEWRQSFVVLQAYAWALGRDARSIHSVLPQSNCCTKTLAAAYMQRVIIVDTATVAFAARTDVVVVPHQRTNVQC